MRPEFHSRRSFLKLTSTAVGGSWIVLSSTALLSACEQSDQAQSEAASFSVLNNSEAADFGAMAARILPTDSEPGATEAGVIYFMDNVLGGISAEKLPEMRVGLSKLRAASMAAYGTAQFSELTNEQQDSLLTTIEDDGFFGTVRYLTIAGMFSHPKHGGNRNRVGWQVLGFEANHAAQPPFGFYDADYAEKGE